MQLPEGVTLSGSSSLSGAGWVVCQHFLRWREFPLCKAREVVCVGGGVLLWQGACGSSCSKAAQGVVCLLVCVTPWSKSVTGLLPFFTVCLFVVQQQYLNARWLAAKELVGRRCPVTWYSAAWGFFLDVIAGLKSTCELGALAQL